MSKSAPIKESTDLELLYIVEETSLIFPVYWQIVQTFKGHHSDDNESCITLRDTSQMCVILVTKEVPNVYHVRGDTDPK